MILMTTLNNSKYHQIMNKVNVDSNMKNRILTNIDKEVIIPKTKPYLSFAILPMVASLVLILGLSLMVNYLTSEEPTAPDRPLVSGGLVGALPPENQEFQNLNELNNALGFSLNEVKNIPFNVEKTSYIKENTIGEIRYMGTDNFLIYRKSQGNEDNSNFFSSTDINENIEINNVSIELKGTKEGFLLALWQDNGFSNSIKANKPLSENNFLEILKNILK